MTHTIEIDQEVYNALRDSFGESLLNEKLNDILLSAVESRLEKYSQEILRFEEKYGVTFNDFAQMWNDGKIKDPHSYEVESDFMDWEMLEMEKKDLIKVLSLSNGRTIPGSFDGRHREELESRRVSCG